jgi:uroporphyrin-III C-methyltransferase
MNTVYLIGAGPGDPELLTIKADKILKNADVIFYDALLNNDILNNYSGEKIYVGKRKGQHYKTQAEINELVLEKAQQHTCVVRLKNGDPFIFGRGGEELTYLENNNIKVEIIPGITAAFGAASSLRIPLTMRNITKHATFIAAHHIDDELYIPSQGTLIFYMGASNLKKLSAYLLKKRPASQACALIQNATLAGEKNEILTIESMATSTLVSPLLIIVGDVVNAQGAGRSDRSKK